MRICDKCRKDISKPLGGYTIITPSEDIDLCSDCMQKVINWVNRHTPLMDEDIIEKTSKKTKKK